VCSSDLVALTDDGALHCVGEVPENAVLALLRAPELAESECVTRLANDLEGARAKDRYLLSFYCAGRRMHLGAAAANELADLQRCTGASGLAGALSLGEIGSRDNDYPLFHNAAIVCRPWTAS
jgi:hypothetical protein